MKFLQLYRWVDLPLNLAVMATYLVLAKIGLIFASASPVITIFWPAGGFALAVLLLGGRKYMPAIFVCAVIAGFMAVDIPWVATMLGVADTVESFFAYWFLKQWSNFNRSLETRLDFFTLALLVAAVASAVSAVIGPSALLMGHAIPASTFPAVAMRWWMGDVIGIAFVTPFILIWSKLPGKIRSAYRLAEITVIYGSTFLVGQVVFFDWFSDHLENYPGITSVLPFVIWAGLRSGRHMTALLQLMLFTQALWSSSIGIGTYAQAIAMNGLLHFWIFGMVLAVGGMALAVLVAESRKVLKQQNRLHRTIAASLNEIYLFDADSLRFCFVNRGALVNLGYTMDEMQAMTPLDLKPEFSLPSFEALINPLRRHELPMVNFETVHKRKDGSLYPIEVHLQLFENEDERYFHAVIMNITDRVAAEQQIKLAAQVFEYSIEGILITDADNHIISLNQPYSAITGYNEEDLKGKNPSISSSGMHEASFYTKMWQAINTTSRWQGELWNRRKDGEIYPVWINISVIKDAKGKVLNYIGMLSDIAERKAAEVFLKHQAQHDFLTNLPNRVLFHDRFQQLLADAKRNNETFALLSLDLNKFKLVNDTYGHRIGDLLLQEVAKRFQDTIRKTDTISRQGGDEFSILVSKIDPAEHAQVLADKLHATMEAPFLIEGHRLNITLSIGIAIYPDDGVDEVTLSEHADAGMYRAKLIDPGIGHRLMIGSNSPL
jgi:diguanylate cyclase (GGDEF)-like protein/PAS domain S-box-containing protein